MLNNISSIPSYFYKECVMGTGDFEKILTNFDKPILNSKSIYDLLIYGYILGEETLIRDLDRKTFIDTEKILSLIESNKNKNIINPAKYVLNLLMDEIESYIGNYKNIGILLSGGLDSRIMAGALKILQNKMDFKVIVFTWGLENSRDVIYSKKIAKKFNWETKVYYQDSDTLYSNIFNNLKIGCETNPLNLHSMPKINIGDADVMLAASYGDSLGRAEYNGVKVEEMKTLTEKSHDNFGFFLSGFSKQRAEEIKEWDSNHYKDLKNDDTNKNILKEISYLKNHHIKYLQISMNIIDHNIPVRQIFTSYELVSYILSLDYSYRYGDLYKDLLHLLPKEIGLIPWARTGKPFINQTVNYEIDNYNPEHAEYALWLHKKRNEITSLIDFNLIGKLGIFNQSVISKAVKIVNKRKHTTLDRTDLAIIFLASLCQMIKKHNIKIEKLSYPKESKDYLNSALYNLKVAYVEHKSQ